MDTVGTGSASQFRLYERQLGWKPPYPRRGRRPSVSGTRFIRRYKISRANSGNFAPKPCIFSHTTPVRQHPRRVPGCSRSGPHALPPLIV